MNVQTAIRPDQNERLRQAREEAYSTPLKDFHPGAPKLFQDDTLWPFFERLRKEEPVHYCTNAPIDPYWSVVKYNDIMHVETNHGIFSSDARLGGVAIRDAPEGYDWPSFIAMDQPKHSAQRKTVAPMFTPTHLDELAVLIRERSVRVLDNLPRNETFNFVDLVSIELTTQMLATLFDFPWEERRKLTRWSDVSTALSKSMIVESPEQRRAEMDECRAYFANLWNERVNAEPRNDLISMMAHSDATRHMDGDNLMGNIILLVVGGNDTTRNTMRRTALVDTEIGDKKIRKGDRVVMWYVSGNRDEEVIENPNEFIIDRARPRSHLSFGFGIHRCVGMRLAELQLKIVWQEILKRIDRIEVVGPPERAYSSFLRGIVSLPVRIPA